LVVLARQPEDVVPVHDAPDGRERVAEAEVEAADPAAALRVGLRQRRAARAEERQKGPSWFLTDKHHSSFPAPCGSFVQGCRGAPGQGGKSISRDEHPYFCKGMTRPGRIAPGPPSNGARFRKFSQSRGYGVSLHFFATLCTARVSLHRMCVTLQTKKRNHC